MGIKFRLIISQFLQFFIWGSWLISFGGYLSFGLVEPASGPQVGAVFAIAGLASLLTPGLIGIIADKWINSERLLGLCHLIVAFALFNASRATNYEQIFPWMLLNAMAFMPTIALNNSVCFGVLRKTGQDPVKVFPPIRVWGTVGFIVAMFVVDLSGWKINANQLLLASGAALALGIYSFTLPPSPPMRLQGAAGWKAVFRLDAFALFKNKQIAVFFIFAVLIGVCLHITNSFGSSFILGFGNEAVYGDEYQDAFAIKHSNIFLSISQISEALFILTIPYVFKRYGIKTVLLMSLMAWVFRFGFFGIGNPGSGVIWLILSMIIYGIAFDFFNISASLYIEKESPQHLRASAQGLLMMVTSGLGSVLGNLGAGYVVAFFTTDGITNWSYTWFVFAGYALIIGLLFSIFFRYKQDPTLR